MSLRCYLRNIGYYRVTKFRFKIIRAERLTYEDVTISFARGTGGSNSPSSYAKANGVIERLESPCTPRNAVWTKSLPKCRGSTDGFRAASVANPPAVGNGHYDEDFIRA